MARKPKVQIHRYKCTITDEEFKTTAKAENPEELISVSAYYELNPDKDDRPEHIKQEIVANTPAPIEELTPSEESE